MKAVKINVIGVRNRIDGTAMPFGDYEHERYWLQIEGDTVYELSRGAWLRTEITKSGLKLRLHIGDWQRRYLLFAV